MMLLPLLAKSLYSYAKNFLKREVIDSKIEKN